MAILLRKEAVIDQWSMIVMNASDKAKQVSDDTVSLIAKSKAPQVECRQARVSTSLLQGITGKDRAFIQVVNRDLPGYEMYIGIAEYGINLDLTWYLVRDPGILVRLINMALGLFTKKTLAPQLDLFKEHDVTVYATVVHRAFLDAVERVTKGTGQEIERKSKGFLGIS